jgi:hypothetical protein
MRAIIRKTYPEKSGERGRKKQESGFDLERITTMTLDFDWFRNIQKARTLR